MIVTLQRVLRAEVRVESEVVAEIGTGGLLFVGMERDDTRASVERAAHKVSGLRVFEDGAGRMNLDAAAVDASWLVVSQFTLAARTERGRRPSFDNAMAPEQARGLIDHFADALELLGQRVSRGRFGAHMQIELVNDGPVTFVLEF